MWVNSWLEPDALAHGDHAAGADREAFPVLLQIDPDHLAGSDDDVLVQDGMAYDGAATHPGARHDHAALHDCAIVDDGAIVEGSVIMPGTRVGRGAVVRHAILDKNVVVGPGEMVGVDLEKDRERFAISAGGVVAVGKGVWL